MATNRLIATRILNDMGLIVDTAEHGEEALQIFADNPDKYDLIFMDMRMPIMDGLESTKKIRQLNISKAKEIPIVAMTANVYKEDIDLCTEAGMNAHTGKPININEILKILREQLKPRQEIVKSNQSEYLSHSSDDEVAVQKVFVSSNTLDERVDYNER
jgi:CheY-like chemotaxis protein